MHEAAPAEVWALGAPPIAVMVLTPKEDALYLGKLAVTHDRRREGLARVMVDAACARARTMGLAMIELQTRIELTSNQAAFAAMGFSEVARTAHPGFDRPTSITYRRIVT
jgi:predicted N-acetyltransferase YhbS